MQDGLVRVLAADPKLMELAFGRIIFDTYMATTPRTLLRSLTRSSRPSLTCSAAGRPGRPERARPQPHLSRNRSTRTWPTRSPC